MCLFEVAPRRSSDAVIDASFASAVRTELDATSWIDHVPGWLGGSDALLDQLLSVAAWEQRSRWMFTQMVVEPRLTAEYPDLTTAPVAALEPIGAALSQRYGVVYDGLWINQYRTQDDSTSWHADWPSCKRDTCIVPVLSLGARRRFLIRPRAGGRSHVFQPDGGDLIVMGGRCQRDWVHCVPKQKAPAGVRVSVNFQSRWQATPG
jgi:alkylated DNA repair dioxygenase AlkB